VTDHPEYQAEFHDPDFRAALLRAGATKLATLVASKLVQDVLRVLRILRNNIHGQATAGRFGGTLANMNAAHVEIPDSDARELLGALNQLGKKAMWGTIQRRSPNIRPFPYDILLEPYTSVNKMLEVSLPLIDAIMEHTDPGAFIPAGDSRGTIQTGPGPDNTYSSEVRARLALLG
jgi:hypothetical protein